MDQDTEADRQKPWTAHQLNAGFGDAVDRENVRRMKYAIPPVLVDESRLALKDSFNPLPDYPAEV